MKCRGRGAAAIGLAELLLFGAPALKRLLPFPGHVADGGGLFRLHAQRRQNGILAGLLLLRRSQPRLQSREVAVLQLDLRRASV